MIPLGTYRHFKGGIYKVTGFAKDSETHEVMVIYTPTYNDSGLWVRPLKMFQELVHDGNENIVPRFKHIGD